MDGSWTSTIPYQHTTLPITVFFYCQSRPECFSYEISQESNIISIKHIKIIREEQYFP